MRIRRLFSLTLCLALCLISLAALLILTGSASSALGSTIRYVATTGNDVGTCTDPFFQSIPRRDAPPGST